MGKYTDRLGKRLQSNQRTNTIRVVVRIVIVVLVIAAAVWLLRRLMG